jgi:hypothetical protein
MVGIGDGLDKWSSDWNGWSLLARKRLAVNMLWAEGCDCTLAETLLSKDSRLFGWSVLPIALRWVAEAAAGFSANLKNLRRATPGRSQN